jgi:hypothetical protein
MSHPDPFSQWIETVSSMLPRVEASASQSAGVLELWHGTGQIVWHQAGLCRLSAASAQFGAEPAAMLARVVL